MTVEAALADPVAVGPYRVVRRLGAGGMGVVYLAEREGRQIAVKVLRPEVVRDPIFLRRFQREFDVSRRVQGVCTGAVLDADLDAPAPYLVTEYIPGPTLAEHVLAEGPLTGDALVAFAAGLAEALAAIHRPGVVHRDLTATNVLLAPEGPRMVDFGIAPGAESTALTGTSVIGTPSWMAPEQARGLPAGPAVDVFAWAALVVYAACGSAPFGQGRAEAVLYRVVHEDPTLPPLPTPLDRLVPAALAKDPTRRPDAFELLQALLGPEATLEMDSPEAAGAAVTALLQRTWVLDHQTPPPEATAVADDRPTHPRRRWWLAGGLLATVVVVAALAALWGQSDGNGDEPIEADSAAAATAEPSTKPPTARDTPRHSPATEQPAREPDPDPEPESEPEHTPAPEPTADANQIAALLPTGHEEVERLVGAFVSEEADDVFVVSAHGDYNVQEVAMTLFVPSGSDYTIAEQQHVLSEIVMDVQIDALDHIIVTVAVGANDFEYHIWGFENGVARRYPNNGGIFTEGFEVYDLDGDGVLELVVFENDCEPSCAEGWTTGEILGWDPNRQQYSRVACTFEGDFWEVDEQDACTL